MQRILGCNRAHLSAVCSSVGAVHCDAIAQTRKRLKRLGVKHVLFLDETHLRVNEAPRTTLVAEGETPYVIVEDTTQYAKRYDMIACCTSEEVLPPIIYSPSERNLIGSKGINKKMLLDYIEDILARACSGLDRYPLYLVLDRARIHNVSHILEAFHDDWQAVKKCGRLFCCPHRLPNVCLRWTILYFISGKMRVASTNSSQTPPSSESWLMNGTTSRRKQSHPITSTAKSLLALTCTQIAQHRTSISINIEHAQVVALSLPKHIYQQACRSLSIIMREKIFLCLFLSQVRIQLSGFDRARNFGRLSMYRPVGYLRVAHLPPSCISCAFPALVMCVFVKTTHHHNKQ